jgi:hypothetical protein
MSNYDASKTRESYEAKTRSYPVQIWIAGAHARALESCRAYCDDRGFCVTVTPTTYVYTGGQEAGVVVGLINYGRFPSEPRAIFARAKELALKLIADLGQESASIQAPDKTLWISFREANEIPTKETGSGQ